MNTWRPEHGRRNATAHTLEILDDVERDMLRYEVQRPSVRSIRIGASWRDYHDFEVEVELAPGCVVAIRYQSVDEEDRKLNELENESGAVAALVNSTVKDLIGMGVQAIAEQLHDLRVETRKALAEWSADGTNVTLIDIRFACTEYWYPGRGELPVEARFMALNDYLRPTMVAHEVEHPDEFMATLPAWRRGFEATFARQAALARQGADGMVDRLVLNAIAQYEDAETAWRTIASGRIYWGSERLTVFTTDGYVRCHGQSSDRSFSWNRDRVTFHGRTLPETVAESLRGSPITSVVNHPILSDDIIITAVTSESDYAGHSVIVEFDQPLLLFCSASGRVWAPEGKSEDIRRKLLGSGIGTGNDDG